MTLLDSNILIHGNQDAIPHFETITSRLMEFAENDEDLVICPRVLYEFYVVVTRPIIARGGLGISSADALSLIDKFQTAYTFINDPVDLFSTWLQLIVRYGTAGIAAHDTRLVAFMQRQDIESIFTMNANDFNRYNDIITILT